MSTNFPSTIDSYSTKIDNTSDVLAGDINDVQDAIEALEVKVGVDSSAVTTTLDYKVNNFFATGRKVYLYENTAPTGWSIVAVTDVCLAVKGGSNAYNVTGGQIVGTWTISGISVDSHVLTVAEIPPHVHTEYGDVSAGGVLNIGQGNSSNKQSSYDTGSTGGGGGHTHPSTHTPGWRPYAAVGIIVTKT